MITLVLNWEFIHILVIVLPQICWLPCIVYSLSDIQATADATAAEEYEDDFF